MCRSSAHRCVAVSMSSVSATVVAGASCGVLDSARSRSLVWKRADVGPWTCLKGEHSVSRVTHPTTSDWYGKSCSATRRAGDALRFTAREGRLETSPPTAVVSPCVHCSSATAAPSGGNDARCRRKSRRRVFSAATVSICSCVGRGRLARVTGTHSSPCVWQLVHVGETRSHFI